MYILNESKHARLIPKEKQHCTESKVTQNTVLELSTLTHRDWLNLTESFLYIVVWLNEKKIHLY